MAGLYIHIPFCHSKCAYCDFYSRPSLSGVDDYIDALIREWSARKREIQEPIMTLYIGGGTPSILSVKALERLLDGIGIGDFELKEFTIEANPEDITPVWIDAVKRLGGNRISMGIQSLVDSELIAIGRRHTSEQALWAIDTIYSNGIENVSCDLIYGLPGQTLETWEYSLSGLLSKPLSHLSAYMLSYEPGTRLYAQRMTGKVKEASDELISEMYDILVTTAAAHGFEHYEISNFGKPGLHSLHNSNYWNQTPYLGLGVSAHSYDGQTRRYNPSDMRLYLSASENVFEEEEPTEYSRHNDLVVTSLRTAEGICISDFSQHELALLNKYVAKGIMCPVGNERYRIRERGWLLADAVMTDFIRVGD